ncbi:Thioredoxin [hydrothermal vent metagenome]|jgi:thioredoxin 1|uniref:Thioredoxin n=2 Tax=ecological metagenomes TaxID=410657 RepID=A0A160VII1_9ZZZZ|nr:thioredoxin TrxA [Candidatus Neomarinimicrobiota bacterium]|tara:strand:+ start:193 stop:519 length:327 start_codon:yes stop_codon:yes gene_type:complete
MAENLIEFTDDNFDTEVLKSNLPVLVDFWAEWCGPCKMIAPIVEEIAGDYAGKVKVGKVNVDFNNQVAMQYGIRGIPALLVFKGGSVANQIVGAVPKNNITQILDEVI